MNTTPLVAMLIPAARQLQQTRDVPARAVLLPVAHATTLAGSVTLIGTSSNLLIAGIASDSGVHVSMLSFAPVALPVCLVGWVLLLLAAPRLLRGQPAGELAAQPWRVEVPIASGAIAVGKRAAGIGIERTQEYALQAIMRHGEQVPAAEAFEAGDQLVFAASEAGVLARSIERVSSGNMAVVVLVFALTTTVMTNLITNAAAASILTPIALGIATRLGLDPVTLLALVATCISFTFINPFSHQSNLMVMGPGAYSTRTFAKFGVPLVVVSLATVSVVTWLLLGGG